MIPLYLKIENFMCHSESTVDFNFKSALILGKVNDNFSFSNGSGKSSIFNAIEFALFNDFQDLKMEKVIRDSTNNLSIVFDFKSDDLIYRIERKRSRSGTSSCDIKEFIGLEYNPQSLEWKNISGRRNSDSENQIKKIIKINQKSFRNSVHFVQNDFSGLTTATSTEKRNILKQIFDLSIYSKLEKLSKAKESLINKSMIKSNLIIDELEDINSILEENRNLMPQLKSDRKNIEKRLEILKFDKINLEKEITELLNKKSEITKNYPILKNSLDKNINLVSSIAAENNTIQKSISSSIISISNIYNNIGTLEASIALLSNEDLEINTIRGSISSLTESKAILNANIVMLQNECMKLESASDIKECDLCLQEVPALHSESLSLALAEKKNQLANKTDDLNKIILELKNLSSREKIVSVNINKNNIDKKNLDSARMDLVKYNSTKDLLDSKLKSNNEKIDSINSRIKELKDEIDLVDISKIQNIDKDINSKKDLLNNLNNDYIINDSKLKSIIVSTGVAESNVKSCLDKISNIEKQKTILLDQTKELEIYSKLSEACSSKGIPSLLINNLLTEIESRANKYLSRIKPGLEILFSLSKENSDGEEVEDFDIKYFYNNSDREYAQMSGAMKFCVTFAIKLALSVSIQNTLSTNIKFLLFDEIDQSLDEVSSNEFVNLVRELEKDYKILVITHNKRLKDKFKNLIVVEQDENMVSKVSQLEC